MFLNKFFHFVKGYVILTVTGFNVERFLYICAKRGVEIWDISKKDDLQLAMSAEDFLKIRTAVRKTRVRVHIKKKMGLPIIFKKYKKRYFMFLGCILFLLTICISSQFIWKVEINGTENADVTEIKNILKESGISVGAFKGKALPSKEIKNRLINGVDNISWAWVYLKGTKAVCEIYEDIIPVKALEDGTPCDIIAARDGIIKRVIAKNGIKKAVAGETVVTGDILISGALPDDLGNIGCVVEASGIVEAYTWHEKTDTYKLYSETAIPTGRTKAYSKLNILKKQFNLFFKRNDGFENYTSYIKITEPRFFKNASFGISLEREYVNEVEIIREQIPYDTAVYDAKNVLEKKIAEELLPGAELLEENVSHRQIDEETVEVTVTMEFIEKIGKKAPINSDIKKEE